MERVTEYLKEYLDYLKGVKLYSDHTLRAYRQDLEQFFAFIHSENSSGNCDAITIREFIASIHAAERNNRTIARKVYVLKSYFRYLVERGRMADDPTELISVPRSRQSLPRILTEKQMAEFLDRLPRKTYVEIRNRAIFETLYATGLRISELTAMKVEDVDFSRRILRTLGKGKKERLIPFNRSSQKALQECLSASRLKFRKKPAHIFLNHRGSPITPRSVERILKKEYRRLMSSDRDVYPHLFRHSFASHLLQRGANLRVIQELLGHANLATTQKYTSLNYRDLLKTYSRFHPRK